MATAVQRPKLNTIIVNRIRQYILDHDLRPGDTLPTEQQLSEKFGVSRISIREATRALGFLGIIDAMPRRGLTLGHVNTDRLAEFLSFHLALSEYPEIEFVKSRIAIEIGGFPFTMNRMQEDPTIYDRLNDLVAKMRNTQKLEDWIELDIQYHQQLMDASGLGTLAAFHDLLCVFFRRFSESVRQRKSSLGVDTHQRIIDALRDQRLADACMELRKHVESHLRLPDKSRSQ